MNTVKIGDSVKLVAAGRSCTVVVTDVIRGFSREPIALEFASRITGELVTLPINLFQPE
jgi:hypothetical protein